MGSNPTFGIHDNRSMPREQAPGGTIVSIRRAATDALAGASVCVSLRVGRHPLSIEGDRKCHS